MKKLFLSIMFVAGIYGLAFGQQASQSTSRASADDPNWEKIGEKTVDLSMDQGIFEWDKDREKTVNANEKYSAIKFKAKDAAVNLTKVEVEYDDGKKQDLSISTPVQANSESKVVDLNSQEDLDKITFNYKKDASASADKAKIEVWGLKSGSSSGMGQGDADRSRTQSPGSMDRDRSGTSTGTQPGTGSQSGTRTQPGSTDRSQSGSSTDPNRQNR